MRQSVKRCEHQSAEHAVRWFANEAAKCISGTSGFRVGSWDAITHRFDLRR